MTAPSWEELFALFEREIDEPRTSLSEWQRPAGPMPEELADRARDVLLRQQERIARIREQQDAIVNQLVALRRVPDAAVDTPAYLDVAG